MGIIGAVRAVGGCVLSFKALTVTVQVRLALDPLMRPHLTYAAVILIVVGSVSSVARYPGDPSRFELHGGGHRESCNRDPKGVRPHPTRVGSRRFGPHRRSVDSVRHRQPSDDFAVDPGVLPAYHYE